MVHGRTVLRGLTILAGSSLAGLFLMRQFRRRPRSGGSWRERLLAYTTETLVLPSYSRAVGCTLEALGLVAPAEDLGAANMTSEGDPLTGAELAVAGVPSAVPETPPEPAVRLVAVVRGREAMTRLDPRLELRPFDTLVLTGARQALEQLARQWAAPAWGHAGA